LPIAYAMAKDVDSEMAGQLRRAALSISLNIAEGTGRFDRDQRKFLITARGSALECAAVLDARIVSMLTKMIG
jgi:four helix bundle protein